MATFKKRSISLSGHATSVALEPEFWAVIDQAVQAEGVSLASLINQIDLNRVAHSPDQPLSSACRVWVLNRVIADDREG